MSDKYIEIKSEKDFEEFQKKHPSFALIYFYSTKSPKSVSAGEILKDVIESEENFALAAINAAELRSIHPKYNVTTVPTVLAIKKGKVIKRLEGLQTKGLYEAILRDAPVKRADGTEAPPLRVTVYSTTTCPHCTTVKNHLRKHKIRFSDVDVSKDMRAGEELMRRSGSAGVPQTDINGTLVVGADLQKINKLLGIN